VVNIAAIAAVTAATVSAGKGAATVSHTPVRDAVVNIAAIAAVTAAMGPAGKGAATAATVADQVASPAAEVVPTEEAWAAPAAAEVVPAEEAWAAPAAAVGGGRFLGTDGKPALRGRRIGPSIYPTSMGKEGPASPVIGQPGSSCGNISECVYRVFEGKAARTANPVQTTALFGGKGGSRNRC
jgi:hypothetical protein